MVALVAVGPEEHRAPRLRRAQQVAQELEGRAVGPLQVVEHEQQRRAARDLGEQGGERVEQALPLHARVAAERLRRLAQLRQQGGEVGGARAEPLRRHGERGAAGPAAQHLEDRPVGAGPGLVEAAVEDDGAVAVRGAGELRGEPRLADPGLAGEQDEPPLVADRRVPRAAERGERLAAPDERVLRGGRREAGGQRAGRGGGWRRRLGRRPVAAQQPLVDGDHGGPGRGGELVAQPLAQLVERSQRLGGVAGRLVHLHQQPVRGLAERRQPDRGAGGVLGGVELAPAEPQPGLPQRLERAQPQALDLAPALAHPRAVALGEERLGAEGERGAGLGGGVLVGAVLERLGGELDRLAEQLGVDEQRLGQREPHLGAAGQRLGTERAPELGEQRGERGVGRGGRLLRPQDVLELVARAGAGAVADEVGEEQLTLASRERRAGLAVAAGGRDAAAEADLPADFPSHSRCKLLLPPTFLQGPAKRPLRYRRRRERSSAGHGASRGIPPRTARRARSDGQHLRGHGLRRAPRGGQAAARRAPRRALRDRGAAAQPAQPPARGRGARHGRRRDRPLPAHGVGRRRGPRARPAPPGQPGAAGGGRHALRARGRRGAALRARAADDPPRRQAAEPHALARPRRRARRLRDRARPRRGERDRGHRHARLHGAGGVHRRAACRRAPTSTGWR